MDPGSAIATLVERLVSRYALTPLAARSVVDRAAARKDIAPGLLAARILLGR